MQQVLVLALQARCRLGLVVCLLPVGVRWGLAWAWAWEWEWVEGTGTGPWGWAWAAQGMGLGLGSGAGVAWTACPWGRWGFRGWGWREAPAGCLRVRAGGSRGLLGSWEMVPARGRTRTRALPRGRTRARARGNPRGKGRARARVRARVSAECNANISSAINLICTTVNRNAATIQF